jgi:polar amino acid transport system substrate-binding protein
MAPKRFPLLTLGLPATCAGAHARQSASTAYNTYLVGPYLVDAQQGLAQSLVDCLDVTVVPYTIFSQFGADKGLAGQLYVAPKPLHCFARHILVCKGNPALLKALNQAIDTLASDKGWLAAMAYFRLDAGVLSGWSADEPTDRQ